MSIATATKISVGEQAPNGALPVGAGEVGQQAWRGLLRAHACLAKRLDAELERAHGLQTSSYEVLDHLAAARAGRMRMRDLAERAQLSRSGLTRLVDRLEREQLLNRCSCDHDARGAYACLTDAGRRRLEQARATHTAVMREQLLSRFSAGELAALVEMWSRIAPCAGSDPPLRRA
jgi:DNA-binding MarR family transcriptional regulator